MKTLASAVLISVAAGLVAAFGQPAGNTPATPAAPAAQPDLGTAEGPDGTVVPVLSRTEHTFIVEDLKLGTGAECQRGANVTINYHGTLTDGKLIDTTRGKPPANFDLVRLIQGWQLGMPGMKVGGVRRLTVPWILGWGERDVMGDDGKPLIPSRSNVIFTIELLDVKNPPKATEK